MRKITFNDYRILRATELQRDGVAVDFNYTFLEQPEHYNKAIEYNSTIRVFISRWVMEVWGVDYSVTDIIAKTAFPYADKELRERVESNKLDDRDTVVFEISQSTIYDEDYPYDLNKIPKIKGHEIIFK